MDDVEKVMKASSLGNNATVRPTVIALHASGSTGKQWSALRQFLAPHADVITPDLLGHGNGPAWHGFDEDIVAADAGRIAKIAASIRGGVHLVGHSYGGVLALRVAIYHQPHVRSIAAYEPVAFRVLLDYNRRTQPAAETIELARDVRRRVRANDAQGAAAHFVDYWSGPGAWAGLTAEQRLAIAQGMDTIAAHFAASMRDAPRLADYRSLRRPTLLLFGRDTRSPMRRIGELLRFALQNATFDTMSAMGHMGPITQPQLVAERIAAFVRQHAGVASRIERDLAA